MPSSCRLPILLSVAFLFAAACSSLIGTSGPKPTAQLEPGGAHASLERVVDGDTIIVNIAGASKRVRYIGMDTPERIDCYFREATEKNKQLLNSGKLTLTKDVSETDRYGRLLRYVYAGGLFVNAELVRLGYASAATFPPDVAHADDFRSLQRQAIQANRGLWDPKICASKAG